jgi:cytochrome d ubiquinol oxidase subunit II
MMGFIWFWLVAVMIVGYVVLDGFDLGVGVLHSFLVRNEAERRAALASIGPVWDGNEVWLLAGGGTLYFAFPLLYASAFSGFYLPLMIVLWLLILRGVSLELRNHVEVGVWRALLDGLFGLSSACSPSSSAPPWPTCCAAFRCKPTATSFCLCGPTGNPARIPAFSTGTR